MKVLARSLRMRHLIIVCSLGSAGIIWLQSPATSVESVTSVSWERSDGSIDPSKLPASLPVLDCQGNVAGVMVDPFASGGSWLPKTASGQSCVSIQTKAGSDG